MVTRNATKCSYARVESNIEGHVNEASAQSRPDSDRGVNVGEQSGHVKEAVVIILHAGYLISGPGFSRTILMLVSLVGFLLISLFGDKAHHYLATDVAWKFRVYIFVAVFSCLSCAVIVFLNLSSMQTMFRFDWNMIDYYQYIGFAFANLLSSTILATSHRDSSLSTSSKEKAIIATSWGYFCMLICTINAFFAHRRRRLAASTASAASAEISLTARQHDSFECD